MKNAKPQLLIFRYDDLGLIGTVPMTLKLKDLAIAAAHVYTGHCFQRGSISDLNIVSTRKGIVVDNIHYGRPLAPKEKFKWSNRKKTLSELLNDEYFD